MTFKLSITSAIIASAAVFMTSSVIHAASTAKLNSSEEKLSYSLGNIIGQRIKGSFDTVDNKAALRGLKDALEGAEPALKQDEMQKIIEESQKEKMEKMQQKMEEEGKENLAASKKFMVKNAKRSGVTTTKSGLQYKNITDELTKDDKKQLLSYLDEKAEKSDKHPAADSPVTVTYVGYYTDKSGEMHVFDSSEKRKKAADFKVNQLIQGWKEGLQLMQPGDAFEFVIPPELAYGKNGIPGVIPPNSYLTFKVYLLKIGAPEADKTTAKK